MKRIFRRRSAPNIKAHSSDQDLPPPLPTLTGGTPKGTQDLTTAQLEMRRGMTLPALVASPSSFSNASNSPPPTAEQNLAPLQMHRDPQIQSAALTATVTVTAESTETKIWKGVNTPDGNGTKAEKILNKLEDQAGTAASSSNAISTAVSTIAANVVAQEVGQAILNGVPALMKSLEVLSKVHPFAAAAFLPFQFAYQQELKRRNNDRFSLNLLSGLYMMLTPSVEGVDITPERTTPDGQSLPSRLAALGEQMKKDIESCYCALDALQKEKLIMRFCQASGWSKQLAGYKSTFVTRRQELQFALTLNTATTVQEDHTMMHDQFMKEFQSYKTEQDRLIEGWLEAHGGMKKVMADDNMCAELIKFQNGLSDTHNIQSTPGTGTNKHKIANINTSISENSRNSVQAAALRKELRKDVASVIKDNLDSFQKRLELSLHLLREDIKEDIRLESERVMNFLKRGPHFRLKDKIMFQVWKDQGWRGSAKTRTVVLALRDYLVERVERSTKHYNNNDGPLSPSSRAAPDDDADDPEVRMGTPLPDSWMLEYLQVQRLRNLHQVLDPDTSGFTTIAEVNTFTRSRRSGWSLPRWISYWAVGWQIFASKYCTEIENIFTQMLLVRDKVGIQMPGNKRYINAYLKETWPIVTGLTSAIERYEGTGWLASQFQNYIDDQENTLRSRLEKIRYDIDHTDTVHVIVGGDPIERSIFILIALLMRRHLAKMHLCLHEEMNDAELVDDSQTIQSVLEAAWLRYLDLRGFYKHQEVVDMKQNFDWFSCGLVEFDYYAWNDWTSNQYYCTAEVHSSRDDSAVLLTIKREELNGILIHDKDEVDTADLESLSEQSNPVKLDNSILPAQPPNIEPKVNLHLKASVRDGQTELSILGDGTRVDRIPRTVEGTVAIKPTQAGQFQTEIKQTSEHDERTYRGVLDVEREVISGTYESDVATDSSGTFIFKRTSSAHVMCHRPLVPRPDAKELWAFACAAVLSEIRRRRPSVAYIYRRMTSSKRFLELMHVPVLSSEETAEIRTLTKGFTVQEGAEIWTLSAWYGHVGDLQEMIYCDSCFGDITRTRVLCLECESKEGFPSRSVDLHPKADCMSVVLTGRDDLPVPHVPTHLLLKTRDALFLKDYPRVKRIATNCLELAKVFYARAAPTASSVANNAMASAVSAISGSLTEGQSTSVTVAAEVTPSNDISTATSQSSPSANNSGKLTTDAESESSDGTSDSDSNASEDEDEITLDCLVCHERVSAPCWYCIDCEKHDTFVCTACETAIEDLTPWAYQSRYRKEVLDGTHNLLHLLIKFDFAEDKSSPEAAAATNNNDSGAAPEQLQLGHLREVEERLVQRLDEDRTKINAMEERLARIEALLKALLPSKAPDGV
ncbi:hypothetical protein B0H11DRAFT_1989365 [Mycena galericulata]|nr:hypothetical protein B0H11DRAFT_1989365 [Mycena galericulata]